MAQVQIEELIDHLNSEMRQALEGAVQEVIPNAGFDPCELFRAFRRAVGRKCNTWERVPDHRVRI
jgi:hypothetical protein